MSQTVRLKQDAFLLLQLYFTTGDPLSPDQSSDSHLQQKIMTTSRTIGFSSCSCVFVQVWTAEPIWEEIRVMRRSLRREKRKQKNSRSLTKLTVQPLKVHKKYLNTVWTDHLHPYLYIVSNLKEAFTQGHFSNPPSHLTLYFCHN